MRTGTIRPLSGLLPEVFMKIMDQNYREKDSRDRPLAHFSLLQEPYRCLACPDVANRLNTPLVEMIAQLSGNVRRGRQDLRISLRRKRWTLDSDKYSVLVEMPVSERR